MYIYESIGIATSWLLCKYKSDSNLLFTFINHIPKQERHQYLVCLSNLHFSLQNTIISPSKGVLVLINPHINFLDICQPLEMAPSDIMMNGDTLIMANYKSPLNCPYKNGLNSV